MSPIKKAIRFDRVAVWKNKNLSCIWGVYQLLTCPYLGLNFFVAPRPWSQSDAISVSNLSDGAPEPSTPIKAVRQTSPRRPIVLFRSSRPLPSYWMRALKTAPIWTIKHKGGTCFMASLICMRKYWEIYFKCLAVSGFRARGGPEPLRIPEPRGTHLRFFVILHGLILWSLVNSERRCVVVISLYCTFKFYQLKII